MGTISAEELQKQLKDTKEPILIVGEVANDEIAAIMIQMALISSVPNMKGTQT